MAYQVLSIDSNDKLLRVCNVAAGSTQPIPLPATPLCLALNGEHAAVATSNGTIIFNAQSQNIMQTLDTACLNRRFL